jgi:hypothetical protein
VDRFALGDCLFSLRRRPLRRNVRAGGFGSARSVPAHRIDHHPGKDPTMKLLATTFAAFAFFASSTAFAAQPNMEAALAQLQEARASLEKATADKGGHRVKAMKALDQAIAEVKAGIEFAKKN